MSREMQKAAEDLVERSRCGDQNATALIIEIRRSALQGSKRAQVGFDLLKKIVARNPVVEGVSIGADDMGDEAYEALEALAHRGPILALAALVALPEFGGEKGIATAAVILANGPRPITKRLVQDIGQGIDESIYRKCFFFGVKKCGISGRDMAREVHGAGDAPLFIHAGRCVGLARAIQRVRVPGSVISVFDRNAGWELGERMFGDDADGGSSDDSDSSDDSSSDDSAPPAPSLPNRRMLNVPKAPMRRANPQNAARLLRFIR